MFFELMMMMCSFFPYQMTQQQPPSVRRAFEFRGGDGAAASDMWFHSYDYSKSLTEFALTAVTEMKEKCKTMKSLTFRYNGDVCDACVAAKKPTCVHLKLANVTPSAEDQKTIDHVVKSIGSYRKRIEMNADPAAAVVDQPTKSASFMVIALEANGHKWGLGGMQENFATIVDFVSYCLTTAHFADILSKCVTIRFMATDGPKEKSKL